MSILFKLQDMVTDNLLTNQEAFIVLQHWELHILRRKYDAAENASKSPIPGAKNIVSQHLWGLSVHQMLIICLGYEGFY
jgi:hypothetical protein